jgi:transposase
MSKSSTRYTSESGMTVGIDVGDKYCHICVLDQEADIVEEVRVPTRKAALRAKLVSMRPSLVVMEVGSHSRWLSRLIEELGHKCLVANAYAARRLAGERKNDKLDARMLARYGRSDPEMLEPLEHRGEQASADLALLLSRDLLVRTRTMMILRVRGVCKAHGSTLPTCDARYFLGKVSDLVPEVLLPAVQPLLETIRSVGAQIKALDKQTEQVAKERYPETAGLRQVGGVGPQISLAYVTVLEDPHKFKVSRAVGSYLGMVPRQSQSGERDPELHITKAGNAYLRRLLVQGAQYIVGPFGPDCHLRRWALRRAGGKNAKKRTVIAVARKLAVLLHRLWITGEVYEPLRGEPVEEVAA